MEGKKRTEIAEIGKFGLIERICSRVEPQNASTVKGCGDDTAVIDAGNRYVLLSTELLLEGVHFDLTYYPLQHLGYKAVVAGISDILAMNGTPRQIELALGIPARFSVEMVDRLYDGVRAACDRYRTDLAGGDTTASVNGLAIGVTAAGDVAKDRIAYRSGAKPNDLICLSGDLGAAYMGLHLLEREKRACGGQPDPKPKFEGHEYILGRQLKPEARTDIIERLAEAGIVPTSMIDITDGAKVRVAERASTSTACRSPDRRTIWPKNCTPIRSSRRSTEVRTTSCCSRSRYRNSRKSSRWAST